jgi:hypothetical protein
MVEFLYAKADDSYDYHVARKCRGHPVADEAETNLCRGKHLRTADDAELRMLRERSAPVGRTGNFLLAWVRLCPAGASTRNIEARVSVSPGGRRGVAGVNLLPGSFLPDFVCLGALIKRTSVTVRVGKMRSAVRVGSVLSPPLRWMGSQG